VHDAIEPGSTVTRWSLILIAAQVADVVTTRAVLASSPRAVEANPFMAAAQAQLGQAWWLPKLAVAGMLVVLLVRQRPSRRLVLAIGLVSSGPVLLNFANLLVG
jgi:Domain of unknown function (DUF5658)